MNVMYLMPLAANAAKDSSSGVSTCTPAPTGTVTLTATLLEKPALDTFTRCGPPVTEGKLQLPSDAVVVVRLSVATVAPAMGGPGIKRPFAAWLRAVTTP